MRFDMVALLQHSLEIGSFVQAGVTRAFLGQFELVLCWSTCLIREMIAMTLKVRSWSESYSCASDWERKRKRLQSIVISARVSMSAMIKAEQIDAEWKEVGIGACQP